MPPPIELSAQAMAVRVDLDFDGLSVPHPPLEKACAGVGREGVEPPQLSAAVLQSDERLFVVVRRGSWRIQIDPFGAVVYSPSFV
jgi:hypothetical protein